MLNEMLCHWTGRNGLTQEKGPLVKGKRHANRKSWSWYNETVRSEATHQTNWSNKKKKRIQETKRDTHPPTVSVSV